MIFCTGRKGFRASLNQGVIMRVFTIYAAFLFFTGLIFAEEEKEIVNVKKDIYRTIAEDIIEEPVIVDSGAFRSPAIIEYEMALENDEIKYWKYQ